MFEKIYPWATFFLIGSALFQTLLIPMGVVAGLLILIALTLFKVVLAQVAAPVKNLAEKTMEKATGGKSTGEEAIKMAKDIKNANIWALIIDYLFTPMNQAEQIFLIIGWAVFPIALAGFVAIYFGGLAGLICNATPFDWCKLIQPIVDIFK